MNVDKYIEKVKECQMLEEEEFRKVIIRVKEILCEEGNVINVPSPVVVCGDVHGQFHDLLELFKVSGDIPKKSYIFMGDYVDRGFNSLETITYLFLLKLRYPKRIFLLRGNHESRQITQIYGFHDEVQRKYGRNHIWRMCCETFDFLSLGAVIDNKIFCVHAGLSPDLRTIDQMRMLDRKKEIPTHGPFADLMWSDPEDIDTWNISTRGSGWCFGSRVSKEFNYVNNLNLICRSHQLVQKGFKYHFKEKSVVTVWSAPNYYYRCGNSACVFDFNNELEVNPIIFKENPDVHKKTLGAQQQKPMYFL